MTRALALVALLLAAAPAAAQQPIAFPSNDGEITGGAPTRIEALLWRPRAPGARPAIVLMHGCGGLWGPGGRLTPRHREWAEWFAEFGFVVVHVDSFRPRGFNEVCVQAQPHSRPGVERARDAYGALAWLQAQPFVDPARIGLMGWSHGGSTTLWTVRDGARARPAGLRHDFAAAVAFYPGCAGPLAWRAGWTTHIPLLVLIGDADDWTPAPPCVALAESAIARGVPLELVLYAGAHHGFDAPGQPLRVLPGLRTASGTATIGTDPAARADAIHRVSQWFGNRLER